ncbi:MAG: hypothetical protein OEM96_03865, partial [Gemmatimonadota bacterium]|nr:hypothetical protein [Gemmatimonadota bacterium]
SRVLVLEAGRILADDSPARLIAGLEAPTIIEVEHSTAVPSADLPPGLSVVGAESGRLVVSGVNASSRLPELSAWLVESGADVRAIRVREPGLEDVFIRLTGRRLTSKDGD